MKDDKRKEYIDWDSYFMGLAAMASFRCKDPNTQNGACIVDPNTFTPISIGYNGMPRGCSDDIFPWAREGENKIETKYPFAVHAESNAIYNAARRGIALEGSTLYLYSEKGYYPCETCAQAIIQSGIKLVVMAFAIKENTDKYDWEATKKMFKAADVLVEVICGDNKKRSQKIADDFSLIRMKSNEIVRKLWANGGAR